MFIDHFFIVYATKISQRNCMNDFIFIYLPYKINEWFNLEFETEIKI